MKLSSAVAALLLAAAFAAAPRWRWPRHPGGRHSRRSNRRTESCSTRSSRGPGRSELLGQRQQHRLRRVRPDHRERQVWRGEDGQHNDRHGLHARHEHREQERTPLRHRSVRELQAALDPRTTAVPAPYGQSRALPRGERTREQQAALHDPREETCRTATISATATR